MDSDQRDIDIYMRGSCHIHAIAAQRLHGGHFAICFDDSEPYFVGDDCDSVSSVIHVWSIHETENGVIARDVLGDIPFNVEAMQKHITTFFPEMSMMFECEDGWIDMQCCLDEVQDLSGLQEDTPLWLISESCIMEAISCETVKAPPGTRPYTPAEENLLAMDDP